MKPEDIAELRELVRAAIAQANELDDEGVASARNAEQIVSTEDGMMRAFVTLEAVPCAHEWDEDEDGEPYRCNRCGMSFMRYAFGEAP
jgi:hypothetical protein